MLAAIEAGVTVVEYTPAEIKRAVVGYGRAEKPQVGADGEDAARPRRDSEAARCDRCARGGDLPSAQRRPMQAVAKSSRHEAASVTGPSRRSRWRDYRPAK